MRSLIICVVASMVFSACLLCFVIYYLPAILRDLNRNSPSKKLFQRLVENDLDTASPDRIIKNALKIVEETEGGTVVLDRMRTSYAGRPCFSNGLIVIDFTVSSSVLLHDSEIETNNHLSLAVDINNQEAGFVTPS